MMKNKSKVISILILALAVTFAHGCAEETSGDSSNGVQDAGARLVVLFDKWPLAVDASAGGPVYLDMEFFNEPTTQDDEAESKSGLWVESFRVQYLSSDEDAVPLDNMTVGLGVYVDADSNVKLEGVPIISDDHLNDFLTLSTTPDREVLYELIFTFTGYNDFGYPFTLETTWFLFIADY